MKVSELIARLRELPADAEVHIAHPSGDYWRTTLAPAVEDAAEAFVKRSEYHDETAIAEGDFDDLDGAPGVRRVVVIR